MFNTAAFSFKTAEAAEAFIVELGAPDAGEAYAVEPGGKLFFVAHIIDGVRVGRI